MPEATLSVVWSVSSALAISSCPVRGKGVGGLEREGELLVGRQIVLIGELDGRVFRRVRPLVEENDGGPGAADGDGEGEGSAVVEQRTGGEAVSCVKLRRVAVGRKGEAKGIGGWLGRARVCPVLVGRWCWGGAGVKMRSSKASC